MTTDAKKALVVPKPDGERLATLFTKIGSGDIKIPTFQRRASVWNNDQVIDLLDSVLNGYPIGSLLFWLTNTRLKSERNVGGFSLPETPERYPRNYVLDGQQRLTALYAVLNHSPEDMDSRFQVSLRSS